MSNYQHPDAKLLEEAGEDAPAVAEHGTEEEVRHKMTRYMPNQWRLEGNLLIGTTPEGDVLSQRIPTTHILTGVDDAGSPILRRVSL